MHFVVAAFIFVLRLFRIEYVRWLIVLFSLTYYIFVNPGVFVMHLSEYFNDTNVPTMIGIVPVF